MTADKVFEFNSGKLSFKAVEGKDGKDYFVEGYISSGNLDLVNDIVTKDCMTDMMEQFDGRTIKLDFEHEAFRGKTKLEGDLNKTKVPLGKAIDRSLDNKGLKVKWQLNPTWKKFDEKGNVTMTFKDIWSNIEGEYYDAFSIAYIPQKTGTKDVDGTEARLLDKLGLLNVALTGNPIDTGANMTAVMAKSLAWLKEREGTTMKSKKEEKGYDKDGAHAHTEENPIGNHNHPEIENAIAEVYNAIDRRIGWVNDRIDDLRPVDEDTTVLKGNNKGDVMTDKEDNPEDTKKPDETQGTKDDPKDTKTDAATKSEPSPELIEVKGRLDTLEKEAKAKDEEIKELKGIVDKAQVKSLGASKADDTAEAKAAAETKGTTKEMKGPLDLF